MSTTPDYYYYYYFYTLGIKDPEGFVWCPMLLYSGQSSRTNESWSRMLLNRCNKTEMRWNKKTLPLVSRTLSNFVFQNSKKIRSQLINRAKHLDCNYYYYYCVMSHAPVVCHIYTSMLYLIVVSYQQLPCFCRRASHRRRTWQPCLQDTTVKVSSLHSDISSLSIVFGGDGKILDDETEPSFSLLHIVLSIPICFR